MTILEEVLCAPIFQILFYTGFAKEFLYDTLYEVSQPSRIVKTNPVLETLGAVDLHLHGAFGIDSLSASHKDLDQLSIKLWKQGVAAFCPTTMSAGPKNLSSAVKVIGAWIQQKQFPGAIPLGIHLEGPFISRLACGAHSPKHTRPLDWKELENLWFLSQGTLKILTLAPENLAAEDLIHLPLWCRRRGIHLSLGHSIASEDQATQAFNAGFAGVTHTWNALPFHHRSPGVLGAALGRPDVSLELIIDQVHVSPTVIRWTLDLHPRKQIYFISDCLAPGGQRLTKDACRLPNGALAGGQTLLPEAYCRWLVQESQARKKSVSQVLLETVQQITVNPLKILGFSSKLLQERRVRWELTGSRRIRVIPID